MMGWGISAFQRTSTRETGINNSKSTGLQLRTRLRFRMALTAWALKIATSLAGEDDGKATDLQPQWSNLNPFPTIIKSDRNET